jgi:signal transduction histidine kinase
VKRFLTVISLLWVVVPLYAQLDTQKLRATYDRALEFDETKADSLLYYAVLIEKESKTLRYPTGPVLSSRLRGIHAELKDDYETASRYYMESLRLADELNLPIYKASALSDLAILHSAMNQASRAKELYLQCISIQRRLNDSLALIGSYANLGVIYRRLKDYDSCLIIYNTGLSMARRMGIADEIEHINQNLGTLYYFLGRYNDALQRFRENLQYNKARGLKAGVWVSSLNICDVMTQKSMFDSANWYANETLRLAKELGSKSKEADSYAVMSKLYEKQGNYKRAFELMQLRFSIDSSLVNERTNEAIARMSESYNARQREKDNKLLTAALEKQRLQKRNITLIAIASVLIAALVVVALIQNRRSNKRLKKSNDFIRQQNDRLAELNYEKNSLISIVSHDLNAPFTNISVWNRLLKDNAANLNAEQQKAVARIEQATHSGIEMIRRVLDVESSGMAHHTLQLADCRLCQLATDLVAGFQQLAEQKNISLRCECNQSEITLLSDQHLLQRIISNLLSNAIKFSDPGKSVQFIVQEETATISLQVSDEGIGIPEAEIPHLFSRYGALSSRPTGGEPSTGLGLYIVKRLVEELGGKISCTSTLGKGSTFTVVFNKKV